MLAPWANTRFNTLQLFGSTRAKARHNFNLYGPFLRRNLVPFYSAIDTGSSPKGADAVSRTGSGRPHKADTGIVDYGPNRSFVQCPTCCGATSRTFHSLRSLTVLSSETGQVQKEIGQRSSEGKSCLFQFWDRRQIRRPVTAIGVLNGDLVSDELRVMPYTPDK